MVLYGANAACRQLEVEPMSAVGVQTQLDPSEPIMVWPSRANSVIISSLTIRGIEYKIRNQSQNVLLVMP